MICLQVCPCEGAGSPGTGLKDSCRLPCRCWQLNPGHLEKLPVLLTNKPPLQPLDLLYIIMNLQDCLYNL